jgi:hypothetical protein
VLQFKKFWQRWDSIKDLPPKDVIRKTKITTNMGLQIKRIITNNPSLTYSRLPVILKGLFPEMEWVPSVTTIRQFLKENGFKRVQKIKKPLLRNVNKSKRLLFAQKNIGNAQQYWNDVLWTDETTVRQMKNGQNDYAIVHNSISIEYRPRKMTLQVGGFSVMFWGAMSSHGFGPLEEVDGMMNGEK